jgi:hypothetical protein
MPNVDPEFTSVDYNNLDSTTKRVIEANASSNNMTGQQYYDSRGGVNKSGYYGDSWDSKSNLTDKEYANVISNALAQGLTGVSIGQAINSATQAKRSENTITNTPTNNMLVGQSNSFSIVATPPVPEILPQMTIFSVEKTPVKTATLDIILFDEESVPTDGMFDQIFENIGGQELISITRSDIVNGQKISYQPIKNLSAIQQRYNPNNILSLQQTADKFFAGFSIKLEDKIPKVGNGTNGENVYLNASGDLVIEFININADEQVETLISASGTIYEADLGDYTS